MPEISQQPPDGGGTAEDGLAIKVNAGERCRGFWEPDGLWLPCVLLRFRKRDGHPKVQWADGSESCLKPGEVAPRRKRKAEELHAVETPTGNSVKGPRLGKEQLDVVQTPRQNATPPRLLAPPPRHGQLPPHRFVMAPMVGGSELPFRMFSRAAGAQLCYTPMIYSAPFATDASYRANPENGFQTCAADRPLVAHFCGNDPEVLLAASRHVVAHVDAIDLNLGCPQRIAHAGHFGSYLLDECDWDLVCSIVKRLSDSLPVPVFCKIRLLNDIEDTLRLVKKLEASGASLLAVHARYRGSPTHRRDGPAHLEQIAVLKKAVRIPILANGNVRCWADVEANLLTTNADGIMAAEGLLDDPCLFAPGASVKSGGTNSELRGIEKKLRQIQALQKKQSSGSTLSSQELEKVGHAEELSKRCERLKASPKTEASPQDTACSKLGDGLAKARRYLELCREFWMPPLSTVLFHLRRMAKLELTKYQLLEELMSSSQLGLAEAVLGKAEAFRDKPEAGFKFDEERASRERKLAEQRKYEETCRKKYEARMAKKAKREKKPLGAVMRATQVPGGVLRFDAELSLIHI